MEKDEKTKLTSTWHYYCAGYGQCACCNNSCAYKYGRMLAATYYDIAVYPTCYSIGVIWCVSLVIVMRASRTIKYVLVCLNVSFAAAAVVMV